MKWWLSGVLGLSVVMVLGGCRGSGDSGPPSSGPGPVQPKPGPIPQPVPDCEKVVILESLRREVLSELDSRELLEMSTLERFAVTSGYFASAVRARIGGPSVLRMGDEAAAEYVKAYWSVFERSGFVRQVLNHKDRKKCSLNF